MFVVFSYDDSANKHCVVPTYSGSNLMTNELANSFDKDTVTDSDVYMFLPGTVSAGESSAWM